MTIHIFADSIDRFLGLHGMLDWQTVNASLLDNIACVPQPRDAVIVRADLTLTRNILALKILVPKMANAARRVFVVDATNRLAVVQALALSATHVVDTPVKRFELLDASGPARNPGTAAGIRRSAQQASAGGARSLASMFSDARGGRHVDLAGAKQAAARIAVSIAEDVLPIG